jgi:predicted acyl esterase
MVFTFIPQRYFKKYPIIKQHFMSCAPYGENKFKHWSKRNDDEEEGYIVVYQDVRGRVYEWVV